ncbi:leucyl/phenylalanyl-tRNA--protein transferase [Methylotenera sp.]|uniref:leucyl/phenylalanyl-tRNA--protein transferase n=1 Tax=Methylotenera sp. TaxID=2051956 RepID=UPI002488E826|nr:leucyl/phenylalanyl-tRNA--protein transferase [Methylotenera sp.]MDI1298525.1 leucyl/phenylalanyl-tRNA--protein transferase [Methylotenera sp.]
MSYAYYQLPNGRVASIDDDCEFPPLFMALKEPNGLIAIGGDLSAARLLTAYQQGIFPWFSEGEPVMWWSPSPRMVLFPDELKVSNSLKKTLKKQAFEIRFNTSFRAVMTACSNTLRLDENNNPAGTWISFEMIEAYCELNRLGYAISMESWLDNQLVGGCYGIKIGRMFYGESMFHHVTDASKVAFVNLVKYLQTQNVSLIDCQMKTPLLASFGGREIDRELFMQHLTFLTQS